MKDHSSNRAAPRAGGKAGAIEIHLSIVDHVLVPRVHGGLNRHHFHSARIGIQVSRGDLFEFFTLMRKSTNFGMSTATQNNSLMTLMSRTLP